MVGAVVDDAAGVDVVGGVTVEMMFVVVTCLEVDDAVTVDVADGVMVEVVHVVVTGADVD